MLALIAAAPPGLAASACLQAAGTVGCAAAELARLAGRPGAALAGGIDGVNLPGGLVMHRAALAEATRAVIAAVERQQRLDPIGPGLDREALRAALPPGAAVEALAAHLVAAGVLVLEGGRLRRPGLDLAALPAAVRALLSELERPFRAGGLSPPDIALVVTGERRRLQALQLLIRQGVLVRAPDAVQKREILFHRDALAGARRALRAHFATRAGGFLAGECGRLLGISRRFSIPLLERLDAERFTRRDGDRRHLVAAPETDRCHAG